MDRTSFENHARAWDWIETREFALEPDLVHEARTLMQEDNDPAVSACEGAMLSMFKTMSGASSVIVIGTGSLVQTARIACSLNDDDKLTAVDSTPQGHSQIKRLFRTAATMTRATLRTVNADPTQFLSRLNGDDYDLIVVCGDASNYPAAYEQAPRLLRRHGVIIFTDVLAMESPDSKGGLTNPADRGDKAVAMRELIDAVTDDDRFISALSQTGWGMLIATLQ